MDITLEDFRDMARRNPNTRPPHEKLMAATAINIGQLFLDKRNCRREERLAVMSWVFGYEITTSKLLTAGMLQTFLTWKEELAVLWKENRLELAGL